MKRKLLSAFTALALCLSLLPGTALADGTETGVVTIIGTGDPATSITLEAGKYVVDDANGGVKALGEGEAVPADKYLEYSSGTSDTPDTLTVHGQVDLSGQMVLNGNLTIDGDSGSRFMISAGNSPALSLNGTTLTLGSKAALVIAQSSGSGAAIKGGGGKIIVKNTNPSSVSVDNNGGLAAENLTVQGGSVLSFQGVSSSGGVVNGVTFLNCSFVKVKTSDLSANIKDLAKGFTSNSEVQLVKQVKADPATMKWVPNGDLAKISEITSATCFKVGESGWAYYEPAAATETAPTLTLENVTYGNSISYNGPLRVELVGENTIGEIDISQGTGNLTLTGAGSLAAGLKVDSGSLTVGSGTKLTIPAGKTLSAKSITNSGTVVNEGTITLSGINAADISGLKLTGSGKVQIKDPSGSTTGTYDNSGKQLLTPAGELDLSDKGTAEDKLADKGYKWEPVVVDDPGGGKTITGGTLTLADGFNAELVTLPDATVTIMTTGDCRIGTLTTPGGPNNANPQKTELTFSGAGKLTIQSRFGLDGGNNNSLTIAPGAHVIAEKGISGGASGVDFPITVNGTLEASGKDSNSAIYAGQVIVGNGGILNVSGKTGVQVGGVHENENHTGDINYNGVFTVQSGGRFTANCSTYNILVGANQDTFKDVTNPEFILDVPSGYLPSDCEVEVDSSNYSSIFIKANGPFTIARKDVPPPSHSHHWSEDWSFDSTQHWHKCLNGCSVKNSAADHVFDDEWDAGCNVCGYVREVAHRHVWSEDWAHDGTHHWHECTAEGCDVTENSQKDGYGEHTYDDEWDAGCNVCGYVREVAHRHVWSEDWAHDGTYHWHECTAEDCDVTENSRKDGYGEHLFASALAAECSVCGYRRTVTPPVTPDPPSQPSEPSGGGDGGSASYPITINRPEHGTVTSDRASASGGRVTLTVTPDSGYALDTLTVADSRGNEVKLTGQGGGKYTFNMPGRPVTVNAVFRPLPDCPSRRFPDLDTSLWYHEAVDFVLENGLMNGYENGLFGPDDYLSRAMLCQILYNREGRPAVTGGGVFTDVAEGQWYAGAVAWAVEKGIVTGHGDGRFGPEENITREQMMVMLWRYAGSPAATGKELRFTDADQASGYALEALLWAAEKGILTGTGGGVLDPRGLATRAQAAQILKNML